MQQESDRITIQECFDQKLRDVQIEKHQVESKRNTTLDFLQSLLNAMTSVILVMLKGQLREIAPQDMPKSIPEYVKDFTRLNWSFGISYFTQNPSDFELMTDLDSMVLNMRLQQIGKYKSHFVYLQDFYVDLANMVAYNFDRVGNLARAVVFRTSSNDRRRSMRTERKTDSNDLVLGDFSDNFAKEYGEYGNMWAKQYNDGKLPSPNQLLEGLEKFFSLELMKKIGSQGELMISQIQSSYTDGFDRIRKMINFPDMDKQFYIGSGGDNDLHSPTSRASFLVLWLYSLEPPFYFHLNQACRSLDQTLLQFLGPFAYALAVVLESAEGYRADRLKAGYKMTDKRGLGTLCGSFLVFRGASLTAKAIQKYTAMIGKTEENRSGKTVAHFIKLQGTTSTSENFKIALDFAKTQDPTKQMVLFVICIHNFYKYTGFRMNTLEYSAHPDEKEVLMIEGTEVAVMGVEQLLIDNGQSADSFWNHFNGKTLTVVYMFHAMN